MPLIDLMRGLEPRQDPIVTQTITRPYATVTAVVTLGGVGAAAPSSDPAGAGAGAAPIPSSPPQETSSSTSLPVTPTGTSGLTPDQLGAILGSIFGVLVLAGVLWCACSARMRRPRAGDARRRRIRSNETSEADLDEERERFRRQQHARMMHFAMPPRPGPILVPPPARFPPTRPTPAYRQSSHPQIRGVTLYP